MDTAPTEFFAFRLVDTGPLSAARNMALDEILTVRAGQGLSPPTLRFLQFTPDAALLGYHQEADRELRLDYCAAENIQINRRLTGGGALLFQKSALGWELIAPQGWGPFRGGFESVLVRVCIAAARAYSRLGVKARFRPRNDIEVGGRKISGAGGMVMEGGALFQGTVLIHNEVDRFLRALRVPVEKLKKREISSLMQRMAFLEDLVPGTVDLERLKGFIAQEFAAELGLELIPGELSDAEQTQLERRLAYFESLEWIGLDRSRSPAPSWLGSILQTQGGTLRVRLWLDRRGKRIQKAFISGDFFSRPQRLIFDLEATLVGRKADPTVLARAVEEFFAQSQGGLLGITPQDAAAAVARAAARKGLFPAFSQSEAVELFLVGADLSRLGAGGLSHLLLPYCAKPEDCGFRYVPECADCGDCDYSTLMALAKELGAVSVSIQSYEHLMQVLRREVAPAGAWFVGSCCEAFYAKHQRELEESGAKGLLINLESTTCYDLGKGLDAYGGVFEKQTFMNTPLIVKSARMLAHG